MFVATAVVAPKTPVVASFLEGYYGKVLLCRRPEMGTLQVQFLQSTDR